MIRNLLYLVTATAIASTAALTIHAQVKVTFDHNPNSKASSAFKFKNVPSPAKDDAAARAKLMLVEGEADGNGADLTALTDGVLPTEEDQPAANFFWNAGTGGGRLQMDLGSVTDVFSTFYTSILGGCGVCGTLGGQAGVGEP